MKLRRFSPVLLAGALCLLLSGCFVKTVDELYTLPRHSDEYDNLQMAIDEVMAADGCSYSAPVSGSNQQSVQLADLDGDGEEEAIVFARTVGEKPLKAYVFDKKDGAYQNVAVIEGNGTAFARVEYVDLDGETGQEILIGRQLTDQVLQSVSAYALENGEIVELMTASYSQFTTCDLDNDGRADLFVLRFDAETRRGAAELYRYRNDQMQRGPEVSLAHDAASVKRIMTGAVAYNIPAVFVTSAWKRTSSSSAAARSRIYPVWMRRRRPCAIRLPTPAISIPTDLWSCQSWFRSRRQTQRRRPIRSFAGTGWGLTAAERGFFGPIIGFPAAGMWKSRRAGTSALPSAAQTR